MQSTKHRPLWRIAQDIRRAWPKVNYAARPYLDAMAHMDQVNDYYGHEDGRTIVRYFIANAAQFRGEQAKALKIELRAIVGAR